MREETAADRVTPTREGCRRECGRWRDADRAGFAAAMLVALVAPRPGLV
jgi:hypothetical protein